MQSSASKPRTLHISFLPPQPTNPACTHKPCVGLDGVERTVGGHWSRKSSGAANADGTMSTVHTTDHTVWRCEVEVMPADGEVEMQTLFDVLKQAAEADATCVWVG